MNGRVFRQKSVALLATLMVCLSLLPLGVWQAAAEKGSTYTNNKTIAARLDKEFATYGPGTYFTYNGKACTDHDTNPKCATTERGCNCRRILDDGTDMLAWQCFGFARYVFYTCFGFIDNAWVSAGKYYSLGSIDAGKLTEANVKALLTKAKTGAHIRVGGHSMAVLSTSSTGVTVIHANVDNQCGVVLQTITWSRFVSLYQWRGVEYVNMPNTYPAGENTTPSTPTLPSVTTKNVDEGVYTLQNVSTGRMMQVTGGKDANETPLSTGNAVANSAAQRFRLQYTDTGRYYLRAMCSSDGKGRVVDVIRGASGMPGAGDKLEIYDAVDAGAQLFHLVKLSDDTYALEIAITPNTVIADQSTAGKQLALQTYNGSNIQKWRLVRVDVDTRGVYTVQVDEGSSLNIRSTASTSGSVVGSLPRGALVPVTKLSNNWGYITYNKVKGWISLDYAARSCAFGSMSGNNTVKAADAQKILQSAQGRLSLTALQKVAADVDLDGKVTIKDALKVLNFTAGKIKSLV